MINLRAAIISIILTLFAYAIWVGLSEREAVMQSMGSFGLLPLLFILGLSLVNYSLRFVRWHWFIQKMGFSEVPVGKNLLYYISGFALTTTPGKAGEAVRSLYLKQHGVDYPSSLAAFVAERFSDLIGILVIALFALSQFPDYQLMAYLTAGVLILILIAIQISPLRDGVRNWLAKRKQNKFVELSQSALTIVDRMTELLGPRNLALGLTLSVVSWSAEAYAFAYIVQQLGFDISMGILAGVYALAMIVGALSFLPGGLGSTEAVMLLLLLSLGVDNSNAVSATLICRVTTLWFAVILGLGALSFAERQRNLATTETG